MYVIFEGKNPRTLTSPEAAQTETELIYSLLHCLMLFYCTIIYLMLINTTAIFSNSLVKELV